MATRIDPELLHEIKAYGAVGIEKCFNCGNCTGICPLTSDEHPFPRNMIRLVEMGMKDRILESTDPWLCYYCGECSETCPKGAEPAETMMAVRRWLTAQYDHSGHSARLYTSEKAVWWTIIRIGLLPLIALVIFHWVTGFNWIVTDHVELNAFAPVMIVWVLVLLHGAFLAYRLITGGVAMFQNVMGPVTRRTHIPLTTYLQEAKTFIVHFATQKRWRDCGADHSRWLNHLLLVSGYVIMLTLVVVFLWWFQTDNIYPIYNPQRWLGYYATLVLIYASAEALVSRWQKKDQMHRFSHPTDWLFPAFILVGSVTGILVHIFRYAAWPWPTYIIYTIHIMAMVAMLDIEVGIGKWTHLLYRPMAMYFEAVKEKASQIEAPVGEMAPAD
jgi:heterodisulfide reductase subunit C